MEFDINSFKKIDLIFEKSRKSICAVNLSHRHNNSTHFYDNVSHNISYDKNNNDDIEITDMYTKFMLI